MQQKNTSLNKLVSLTFDEDPRVRKEAAKSLGEVDDPAAIFALVELSYDKDPAVKTAALDILDKKKHSEKEVMSFAEMFSSGKNAQEPEEKSRATDTKERVLQPIRMLFEKKLGKEKAERVREKMMPAIEKIYMKKVSRDPLPSDESDKKAMQEFLTSYLEAVSDMGSGPATEEENFQMHEQLAGQLEAIGTKEKKLELVTREVAEIEAAELEEEKQEVVLEKLPDTFFKKAYETMMLSEGDDEVMHRELKRMVRNAERDARLAFSLAKKKFKETNITHLTKLRNNMRNVNTEDLTVRDVESNEYAKTKKTSETVTRILVNDLEGNEGVVYLFDGRGSEVKPGMKIRVFRGYVKTFDFSGETALTISKKGNVYIVL